MQVSERPKPPVGVVFDCDMGSSIEDVLALALLYGLDGKDEARVTAVSISRPNLNAAAFAEVMGRFYAGAVSGDFGAISRTLPIGLATDGKMADDTPMLTVPLSKKTPEGKPVYAHDIDKITDTAEPHALIRNALTAQHDQNALVVLTGPASNLVKALALPGFKEIAEKKVRLLSVVGGVYPEGGPDSNIRADIPAARKLFASWPGLIVAMSHELGKEIKFPAASIEKDFAWSTAHPVVDAYRAFETMPYDAPASEMLAVLYAVRPEERYFKLSEPGTITVLDDGRTKFTPSADGKHRYLMLDAPQRDRVIQALTEVASARPVPRRRRRRPPEQQQQQKLQQPQQQPPKPAKPQP